MKNRGSRKGTKYDTQVAHARNRIEQMEGRVERARTHAELAEARIELAEARTELAETRTELAETRAEQAETTLQHVIQKEMVPCDTSAPGPPKELPPDHLSENPLERLTVRQRQILQHIAEGRNTKQIAELLDLSPKTVEYHRGKLMDALGVHDIPGLVRLAVRAGLVPVES